MKTLDQTLQEIRKMDISVEEKKILLIQAGLKKNDIASLEFTGYFNPEIPLTFGVEMECYNVRYMDILNNQSDGFQFVWEGYNHVDRRGVYKFTTDSSISGADPRECVSPILDNTTEGFNSLKACVSVLNRVGARVNRSCGLHVHVGVRNMSPTAIVNIYKNYQKLEALIDSFMAPSRRGNTCQWCRTLQGYNFDDCETPERVYRMMHSDRYHKVNPQAWYDHGTVEFRQHQGTLDYEKISMWVNFCCKLVDWSKKHVLTESLTSIDDIPFLNQKEKEFFNDRVNHFAMGAAA